MRVLYGTAARTVLGSLGSAGEGVGSVGSAGKGLAGDVREHRSGARHMH